MKSKVGLLFFTGVFLNLTLTKFNITPERNLGKAEDEMDAVAQTRDLLHSGFFRNWNVGRPQSERSLTESGSPCGFC